MIRYMIRRLLWACVLFIAVTIVSYVLFYIIPANPAKQACGQACNADQVARVAHNLGLDRPIWYQYWHFFDQLVFHFSLGRSYFNRESVNQIVGDAAPVTASLVFGGAIVWMLIALPIGVLSALRPRSIMDRASMTFVLIGISAHPIWIGLIFAYFFGYKWGITPITGYADFINPPPGQPGGPVQWAYHMILPWMTFAILFAALYVRMIRANVLDTMNEDYVRTARAKGAPEQVVLRSHILRNALLPIVTMLGMDIGLALGRCGVHGDGVQPAGIGQYGGASVVQLRHAHGAGDHRLRHDGDHHLQPHRRPALCLHRPTHQADIGDSLMALLEVNDLKTYFRTDDGIVKAVDGVSFSVEKGKTLGIVGESGSGKSVTCLTIMGLNNRRSTITSGTAKFRDEDLLTANPRRLREIRGNDIAMIFQDPMTSLNPVHTIGRQLNEAVLLHQDVTKKQARLRSLELLKAVGIPRAERRIDDYPHQFSGGMRQRVMIAMALVNNPDLLIADEPTTALDVTTQAQIVQLMNRLQEDFGSAIIMITHDLGVVAETADDVVVMYAAQIVEQAPVDDIFTRPQHPYTWGLIGSLPRLDADVERLVQISGQPPSLLNPPRGCRFHPRCPYVMDICKTKDPELRSTAGQPNHRNACHLDQETKDRESAKLLAEILTEAG